LASDGDDQRHIGEFFTSTGTSMHKYEVIRRDQRDQLGEGPLWSSRQNAIFWVDILQHRLQRLSLADGSVSHWSLPEKIGWVAERRDAPGFIAGLQSGFAELTLEPLAIKHIADPEPELPGNRMNDAKVDHHGRIWAGTMDVEIKQPTGSLYRLDPDLKITRMDSGYMVTNGPVFSRDFEHLYHNDTARGLVYRFNVTPEGTLTGKKVFLSFPEDWGVPDGMTLDAEGCLWIAHWGGGRVTRFDPDGQLERLIKLPASQITSCTFGGEGLDRMFITSAAVDKGDEPLAGSLFEVDPGVRGLAPHYFAG
jgi:sugar lactone lactonase YvrE